MKRYSNHVPLLWLALCLIPIAAYAAIKYFTDYPNNPNPPLNYAIPLDTGQHAGPPQVPYNYITVGQLQNLVNGSGTSYTTSVSNSLYQYVTGGFVLNFNGLGTNESFWGPTTFLGTNSYGKVEIFDAAGTYVAGFDTNKGGFWGFGNLNGFTNLPNAGLVNSSITIQGSAVPLGGSTLAAGSSPAFNSINFTNNGYALPTNNVGGAAFVFGGPGTAATLYDTNITAATTLKLFDITACGATAGGIKIYVTCSGGTDRILTFPAGCSGAGLGTPPAVTITNGKAAFFDVIYKPGAVAVTNVFWSPVY